MSPRPFLIQRLATFAALAVAFLIMASVFVPDRTRAASETEASVGALGPSIDPHADLMSLGTLHAGPYTITIHASQRAPLYSVYDRDGSELGVLLTPEQVETRFPDLPIRSMDFKAHPDADAPMHLMRAEPIDFGR